MTEQSQETHIKQLDQIQTDSIQFKMELNQRSIKWLKDQNTRQNQKIHRLEAQLQTINKQKNKYIDTITLLQKELQMSNIQINAITKKLQIRTHRFEEQQKNNISKGQKDELIICLEQAQAKLIQSDQQICHLQKQNHELLLQIQTINQQKIQLNHKISQFYRIEDQHREDMESIDKLYREKQLVLLDENQELKNSISSLLLQLKLYEKKKEIDGLLTYENNISNQPFNRQHKNNRNTQDITPREQHNNRHQELSTFRQKQCCLCLQLQQQLFQRQELLELMKQRSFRLEKQLQSFKKRCNNLQNIICSERFT